MRSWMAGWEPFARSAGTVAFAPSDWMTQARLYRALDPRRRPVSSRGSLGRVLETTRRAPASNPFRGGPLAAHKEHQVMSESQRKAIYATAAKKPPPVSRWRRLLYRPRRTSRDAGDDSHRGCSTLQPAYLRSPTARASRYQPRYGSAPEQRTGAPPAARVRSDQYDDGSQRTHSGLNLNCRTHQYRDRPHPIGTKTGPAIRGHMARCGISGPGHQHDSRPDSVRGHVHAQWCPRQV